MGRVDIITGTLGKALGGASGGFTSGRKEIIELLHREIVRSVALPDVKERLDAIGFVPVANTPDEFAAVIKMESERWAKVIRAANIKAEL